MRANGWSGRVLLCMPAIVMAAGLTGCKTLSERYIALEVWKYERCFGHLPPGFTPPGAAPAAAPGRVCGQAAPCAPAPSDCGGCQGAVVEGGMPMGAPMPAGVVVPGGPGGSPGPLPAPVGASKPIVISDEVVMP